jgi:8-oxo-dGTP pyrophosphatase MutT (NUDIX family)
MTKVCDNKSVGVIVRDLAGRFALLKRAKFPVGIAPSAGHIDDHGSPEQAAVDEVREELGIKLDGLTKTPIYARRVENICRRPGGDHHAWYVYESTVADTALEPDADEARGADWYSAEQLNVLADRTRAFHAGKVSETDWTANPGFEEVWLPFMEELSYVGKQSTKGGKI